LEDQGRTVQPEPVRGEKVPAAKPSEVMRPASEIPEHALRFVCAPSEWKVEEERALEEMIRQWHGGLPAPASQEIPGLIGGPVSLWAALPTGVARPVNISSPPGGGEGQRSQGFWLNVNAELVIYGATEPDARVTIAGRAIQLRPDGTFSYRFALPDGTYLLPVIAVSKADDARKAELGFSRWTKYTGEVGAHPQDPGLKSPSAEGVA
jgi:hypothetical protein